MSANCFSFWEDGPYQVFVHEPQDFRPKTPWAIASQMKIDDAATVCNVLTMYDRGYFVAEYWIVVSHFNN